MSIENLLIKKMTLSDLEEIKYSLDEEFDSFWSYSVFLSELKNPNSTYFVLKKGSEIIGFAGILIVLDTADITNIVIKKTYRNLRYV